MVGLALDSLGRFYAENFFKVCFRWLCSPHTNEILLLFPIGGYLIDRTQNLWKSHRLKVFGFLVNLWFNHRVFIESTFICSAPIFCDHLNAMGLQQLKLMQPVNCTLHGLLEVAWVITNNSDCSSCDCSFGYLKFVGRRSLEKLYGFYADTEVHHWLSMSTSFLDSNQKDLIDSNGLLALTLAA